MNLWQQYVILRFITINNTTTIYNIIYRYIKEDGAVRRSVFS